MRIQRQHRPSRRFPPRGLPPKPKPWLGRKVKQQQLTMEEHIEWILRARRDTPTSTRRYWQELGQRLHEVRDLTSEETSEGLDNLSFGWGDDSSSECYGEPLLEPPGMPEQREPDAPNHSWDSMERIWHHTFAILLLLSPLL